MSDMNTESYNTDYEYEHGRPAEPKTFFNGNLKDLKPKKGIKIAITKVSNIDEYIWVVWVGSKEFSQTRQSHNWGRYVKPSSELVLNILREILGIEVYDNLQYPSYKIGKNKIEVDYSEGNDYHTELETPEELKIYIISTIRAIQAKIMETKKEESVIFYI